MTKEIVTKNLIANSINTKFKEIGCKPLFIIWHETDSNNTNWHVDLNSSNEDIESYVADLQRKFKISDVY